MHLISLLLYVSILNISSPNNLVFSRETQAVVIKNDVCGLIKSADEYMTLARDYHTKGIYFLAIESYSCAIRIDPQRMELYLARANELIIVGQFQQAIDDIRKFQFVEPNSSIPHALMAGVYIYQANYSDALTEINDSLKLNDSEPFSYLLRGRIYVGLNNEVKALESFNQYVQMQTIPAFKAYGYAEIGFAYEYFGESISSLIYLNKAVVIKPDIGTYYLTNAQHDRARSDFEMALDNLNKAIKLTPDLASAYYERSVIYVELKDTYRALNDCDKIIQLQPKDARGYACRGIAYIDLGQTAQAIDEFNHAIGLDKNFLAAYSSRAIAELYVANYDQALSDINFAITSEPLNGINYRIRAEIQTSLNHVDEAITDFETYLHLQGGNEINPDIVNKIRRLKAKITNI
jgi:tetratricopeptide (TPR) repeat protein